MDNQDGGTFGDARSAAAEAARKKVLAVYQKTLDNLESETQTSPPQPEVAENTTTENYGYSAPTAIYSDGQSETTTYNSENQANYDGYYAYNSQDYSQYNTDDYAALNNESQTQENSYNSYDNLAPQVETRPTYDSEASAMKDVPVNQENINEEWQQYHSQWQQYYQKYYSDYYSQAAQKYLEQEKLKSERVATGKVRKARNYRRLVPVFVLGIVVLFVLFLQYNRLIFAPIMAYVSPDNGSAPTSIEAVDPNITQAVSPEPRLLIPKLNIDVPVLFDVAYTDMMEAMNQGVARFSIPGANALPGQVGNLVISGHSAGDIYSSNPYKFIFSGLERLSVGDLIYVNYNSVRYTYRVTGDQVVEPSDVQALLYETDKPVLTLITCTPLGTSRYRLLVSAEQINPTYDGATPAEEGTPIQPNMEDYAMPENPPSFFQKIWNGIFHKG